MIRRIETTEDMEAAWQVRKDVFVNEQHVPLEEELDDLDHEPTTIHLLVVDDRGPVGTGRILLDGPGRVHLGRICILQRVRGTGIGKKLIHALEDVAAKEYGVDGHLTVELSAQDNAQGFYERLGYTYVDHRAYLDAGIWHKDMIKTITGDHAQ